MEYDKRRAHLISYYESVKHAQSVQVDDIPLPTLQVKFYFLQIYLKPALVWYKPNLSYNFDKIKCKFNYLRMNCKTTSIISTHYFEYFTKNLVESFSKKDKLV